MKCKIYSFEPGQENWKKDIEKGIIKEKEKTDMQAPVKPQWLSYTENDW